MTTRQLMLTVLLAFAVLSSAGAQGVASGTGIRVRHERGQERLARRILDIYPGLREDVTRKLGIAYPRSLEVVVVRGHDSFNAVLRKNGGRERPEHVAAVAFGYRDLIVLKSSAWTRAEGDLMPSIFEHEIAHCVVGHLEREHAECFVPRWFDEGVAQWVSERVFHGEPDILDRAAGSDALLPFDELVNSFPEQEGASALAYAQSLSLVRFISRLHAEHELVRGNIRAIFALLARGWRLEAAIESVTGMSMPALLDAWRADLERRALAADLRLFPQILFGAILLVSSLLGWATLRVRRARRLREFDEEEPVHGL